MLHARKSYNHIQDPLGIIPEDEPVFLLRAKDKLAPGILEEWGEALHKCGGDPRMVDMAYNHAEKMRAYQAIHGCKLPDLPLDGDGVKAGNGEHKQG